MTEADLLHKELVRVYGNDYTVQNLATVALDNHIDWEEARSLCYIMFGIHGVMYLQEVWDDECDGETEY